MANVVASINIIISLPFFLLITAVLQTVLYPQITFHYDARQMKINEAILMKRSDKLYYFSDQMKRDYTCKCSQSDY